MVERIPGIYEMYSFTDEEMYEAAILTPLQLMYIQTELAIATETIMGITGREDADPNMMMREFMFWKGRRETLSLLIINHEKYIALRTASSFSQQTDEQTNQF